MAVGVVLLLFAAAPLAPATWQRYAWRPRTCGPPLLLLKAAAPLTAAVPPRLLLLAALIAAAPPRL